MTEHSISSAIEKYVTSQEGVTDFPITYAQIMDEVDTRRIRVIEEQDRASLLVPPFNLMTQTIEFNSKHIKRIEGTNKLYVECPRLFYNEVGNPAISYVGSIGSMVDKQYRIVVGRQLRYANKVRWLQGEPIAQFLDDRIYLHHISPSKFTLRAVFQRPRDLEIHGYNPEVNEYPLSNGKIDIIIGKTAESYLRTLYRTVPQPNQSVDLPQPPQNA